MTVTEPVNDLHKVLRTLSATNPTLDQPIQLVFGAIKQHGYNAIRNDPGVRAWVSENRAALLEILVAKRAGVLHG